MSSLLFLPFYVLIVATANLILGYVVAVSLGWGPKPAGKRNQRDGLTHGGRSVETFNVDDDAALPTSFLLDEEQIETPLEGVADLPEFPVQPDADLPVDDLTAANNDVPDQWDDAFRALAAVELPTEAPTEVPVESSPDAIPSDAEAAIFAAMNDTSSDCDSSSDEAEAYADLTAIQATESQEDQPIADAIQRMLDDVENEEPAPLDVSTASTTLDDSSVAEPAPVAAATSFDPLDAVTQALTDSDDESIEIEPSLQDSTPSPEFADTSSLDDVENGADNLETLILQSLSLDTPTVPETSEPASVVAHIPTITTEPCETSLTQEADRSDVANLVTSLLADEGLENEAQESAHVAVTEPTESEWVALVENAAQEITDVEMLCDELRDSLPPSESNAETQAEPMDLESLVLESLSHDIQELASSPPSVSEPPSDDTTEAAVLQSLSEEIGELSELAELASSNVNDLPANVDIDMNDDLTATNAVLEALADLGHADDESNTDQETISIEYNWKDSVHSSSLPPPHITTDDEISEAVRIAIANVNG